MVKYMVGIHPLVGDGRISERGIPLLAAKGFAANPYITEEDFTMKGRFWKRALALLLAVVLLTAAVPLQALASVRDLLDNSAQENQAILDQLTSITGSEEDAQRYYQLMRQYNLLDEDGHTVEEWSVTMDGEEVSVDEIRQVLAGDYDSQKMVWVDGTPVTLENLELMLEIEDYIAYLSETYFSQQEWTEEQLASFESLQQQVQESGIQIFAANDEPIIGSGGVSHSARVVVNPTPDVQNGTATFTATLTGAAEGQQVTFDWKALSGIDGLASGSGTVTLEADGDGKATASFEVTLNETLPDTVLTTVAVPYYVNLSNITNALFSTNDGNGGTAEAMTIACTAVQGGNVPDDYLNQLKPGGYFTASFSMGSYHSNEVTTENPTEADIEPVEVTVDEFSKYLIKNGLVDTLRAQSNLPANNETGQYFIDRVPQKINDDLVQWSDGDPLDLPLSPIPDTVNTMDGVDQNVWELTHLAQDPAAFYPNTPEPSVFTDDYAGAALYEPTFYLNDTYLGSKKFGAQGAKNLVLGRTPFYYTWYQIGPVYEWGDGSATFDMPMSPDTKQQLLQDGTLAITTPLYAVTTAYEGRSLYKDINKKSGTEETIKVGDETYTIWFHNGGFARLKLGQTQNSSVMDGDPFLYHHVFRKIDDIPELSRNFYHIATYGTAVYLANTNAPVVQTITAPEGEYYPGQVVPVTVTFDEPVNLRTVQLVINGTPIAVKAGDSDCSNVVTVPYTVENNQGATVNVKSVTASDTAGNKLEAYNPGGDDGAGQQVEGVTLKSQASAAVESLSGEATGPLNDPKATLTVKLSENENDVQWLEAAGTTGDTLNTDYIALRKVGDGVAADDLIPLSTPGQEANLTGATLTAEVDIDPNDTQEEKTVVFELLLNGQVAVGKVITVTQRPFFAIETFDAEMKVVDGEGNEYVFDKPYDKPPQIYRQYDPAITLQSFKNVTTDTNFQYNYGDDRGFPLLTTFQVKDGKYVLDEEGNMIPETEEADFAVWITEPSLATVEIEKAPSAVNEEWTVDQARITPIQDGSFQVHVTALNGGLAKRVDRTAFYYSGSGLNTRHDTFYIIGGLNPFFNIPNDEIRVTAGQDATVYWSSNLWDKNTATAFEVKVTKGDEETPVYETTVSDSTTAPSRAVIPESVLRYTSGDDADNTYTVTVTAKLGDTTQLQPVTATIVVEPSNAKVTLASLPSYYLLDGDQDTINLTWSVEADPNVDLPFAFTVTKDGQTEPVLTSATTTVSDGSTGTETLQIGEVELNENDPNSYRDVYTVTAQVTNGDSTSLSYDSFLLYVYSKEALDIVVQNAETGEQEPTAEGETIQLNNNNVKPDAEGYDQEWQQKIIAMNRDIHLKEVISLNYGTYAWNEVADQIKWSSTNSAVASIDYKQGAVYENIENFEVTTYRPTSDFLLAGHQGGNTTVTATHNLLQQLTDSVEVQVETLKDKLYLFQCYPQGTTAGETTLTFDVYTDASRKNTDHVTITSDDSGAAAYYAEFGIASDVTCSYQKDSIQYYGTFYKDSLESGEPDAARMGLYPCNNLQLRRAAYADLYVKDPDGTPYTGKIVFRGGVYVGEKYQDGATFRLNTEDIDQKKENQKETGITVDLSGTNGRLQVAMDITEWRTESGATVTTGDPITYIFQIEKEGGNDYYPLLVSIDATTNLDNFVDRGESVITFRNNPEENEKHPFIALQAVTYPNYGALTNVLDSTGKVGPSDSLPVANLSTAVLWWGAEENTVDEENASLRLVTENGIPVADVEGTEYTVSNTAYPFSNLVATQYNVTLDKDSMEGVLGKGETTGLQLEYYPDGESLSRRETLSFLLVNLLGVGKVEEAKSLSEMMTTMGSAADANAEGADKEMSTADQYVNKALQLVAGDGFSAGNLFTIQITPTSDPTKFLGFIEVNIGDLHADDSEGKGQVYANFNPGEDVQKSYAPGLTEMMFLAGQKTANQYMEGYQKDFDDAAAGKGSRDIEFALGGYAESLIYYNAESGGWEVQILNGGFNAGGGMSYSWNFNTWCGPVPFTFSLTVGGSADISMDALSVAYYDTAAHTNGLGTDFLTQLRIYLYVRFFAGVGFDYSVVAFKLGVYGEVSLDMRFRWLNRPYMSGKSNIINTADGVHSNNMDGQSFQVNGEIGLEFMVTVLFISYDKILFSYRFNLLNKVTNHWETIDTYWENNQNANQAVIEDLVQNGSLSVYSSGGGTSYSLNLAPTLQSKDYLAEGGRRWGKGISLFALDDTNGLARLETNTYPFANPLVTDDGELLVYISDMDDAEDVENTRIAYATKSGDSYGKGDGNSNVTAPIPSPTDPTTAEGDDASTERTDGYGDSQAALAGKKDFAVAAWTRQMGSVEKDENELGDIVLSGDDQRMMLNSADVFASVYNGSSWDTINLSTDNPGSPDLAPVVATNGQTGENAKAIVAWRQVVVSNGTAGEDGAQYANVTDFSQKDTIVYRIYSDGSWDEKKVLYNGTSGTVKGLQAAMLADGTAAVTYTLDTDGNGQSATDREIAYTVVSGESKVVRSVRVTTNGDLDENPQITTATIGGDENERFILGWYTEKKVATQASQAAQADAGKEEFETESDIRLLEFDKDGVAGKRLPDSLSQAADEDVRVTSTFRFAKNVDSIEDLSILWVEREEEQKESDDLNFAEIPAGESQTGTVEENPAGFTSEVTEWDVLQGVRLYANEGAYRFTGSMALADMKDHSVGTLIDSFDAYVSNHETNEVKAVILGTTYGGNGQTKTETAETVGGDTVQYTVPHKTSAMYTATGSYTDSIEVLGLLVDYDAVQPGATMPIQFTVKNNGIHAVDTLTVNLDGTEAKVFNDLNLLPGQSTTLSVNYTVPTEVVDVEYTIIAAFGSSGATGQADTGATQGFLGLFAKTGGETAQGTVYLDLPDLSVTKAAIVKEEGGDRTIQIQLNNHSAADLEENKHEVQLRFYSDATCETPLAAKYFDENGGEDAYIVSITKAEDLKLINNGGFATQVTFDAGRFVQDKSTDGEPQELPAGGVNVFIQAVVLGEPAKENEEATRSGEKVVQGEPLTTDNNGTVTAENLALRTGKEVSLTYELAQGGGDNSTDVTVTVTNNLLTQTIKGNVTAVLLGKDGNILASQQLATGEGNNFITLSGEQSAKQTLTFANTPLAGVASVKLVYSEAVTPAEDEPASAELSSVELEGAVLTATSDNSYTFQWGQGGSGLLVLVAKDQNATITYNGETKIGSFPLNLTVGQTGTLTVTVTNGTGENQVTKTYTIHLKQQTEDTPGGNPGGGGGGTVTRPTYPPTVSETEDGTVTVSPTRPHQGDKVTITATPDEGYKVGEVIVTKPDGEEVAVTGQGGGKYTFTQPSGKVTIHVAFVPEDWRFTDVPADQWYFGSVKYVFEHGIMEGMSPTIFSPNSNLTRAQVVQILYNLEGKPEASKASTFTDLVEEWYKPAIAWAESTGVVQGYGDGTFRPGNAVTREEFARMMYNYAAYKGYDLTAKGDLSRFPDGDKVDLWAQPAMTWANGCGLINGHDDGTLEPKGTTTRGQAAAVLMRFHQNVAKQ